MTRMTSSEAFVETLAAQGVTHVFGIVGSAYMDALDLFPAAGIRFVSVAHEQGAGHMADGFSRASGRHGVCIAQNGPGITNFVTAIAAAYWAHSPVVVITPETGSNTQGLGGFQETEQLPFFEKITKYQVHCPQRRPHRRAAVALLRLRHARARAGPVQHPARPVLRRGRRTRSRDRCGSSAAPAARRASPPPPSCWPAPGSRSSSRAAAWSCRTACAEVVRLAEHLSAPVISTYLHNDSFPRSHPLWAGPIGYQGSKAAMKLLAQADVVLALGTRLGPFGTLPQHGIDYWPKDAKLIQVDANPRKLGLVKQAAVGICGDARAAATDLLEPAGDRQPRHRRARHPRGAPGRDPRARRTSGRPS